MMINATNRKRRISNSGTSFQLLVIGILVVPSTIQVTASDYGVDVSWPMHHEKVSTNYPWLPHNVDPVNNPVPDEYKDMVIQPLRNVQSFYERYMAGCIEFWETNNNTTRRNICNDNEKGRIEMSTNQPRSMKNFTKMGFAKIRAPDHVFTLLKEFWDKNHMKQSNESWSPGNIYTNNWEARSTMISVENADLEGGGYVLKQHIWNAARDTIEDWTGYRQAECSLYGIRIYKDGAVLAPHVDRNPLVASAIINVAQDVDEPWPLEVIGHDGKAHNVTMLPGDMVLYESHSVIHGRQFPLKGRYMANVFIHFEPIGPVGGQVEYTGDLPPYILPGSPAEKTWRAKNPNGHKYMNAQFTTGSTELHKYASLGDVDKIQHALDKHQSLVNVRDTNGWTPLHEAVRKGNTNSVQLLLDRGAEVNARVHAKGDGGSVLWLAKDFLGETHDIVRLLLSRGAKEYKPYEKHEL